MRDVYVAETMENQMEVNPFDPSGTYDRRWTILQVVPGLGSMLLQSRNSQGMYMLSLNPGEPTFGEMLADTLQYETDHDRKVALFAPQPKEEMDRWVDGITSHYRSPIVRPSDPRFLVHSTPLETYALIQRDGMLKSFTRLRREGSAVTAIGQAQLAEPEDYLDYIMLACGGYAPELVVLSRLSGALNFDVDAPYRPQARMYFDGHRLVRDGLLVRDVSRKVADHLPLDPYLVRTVLADDLTLPEGMKSWTPATFSAAADAAIEAWTG